MAKQRQPIAVFYEVTPREREYLAERMRKVCKCRFSESPLTVQNAPEASDAEIVSVFIYSQVDRAALRALKSVRLITTRSTGFNHIDLAQARKRKVLVSNVPRYGENTVAEHTFGLILCLSRRIRKANYRTQHGDFSTEGLTGFDLKDKTLGVIGAGAIGLHVIKIARGFGMRVLAYDIAPNRFLAEVLEFEYVDSLDTLLSQSDVLTLHCPYNGSTHHMINMRNIKRVKRGCLFINTARAGLIQPEALYYGLETGIFGGAGLDVFEGEQLNPWENQMLSRNVPLESLRAALAKSALANREDVVITPHIAFDSVEAIQRILDTTCENITGFLAGRPQNLV